MPSILDMDQAEAAGYFQKLFKMKLFTCCAQYLDACCPMACRESLCCRVCTAYCSGVFCGWWLVGNIWVQPLRATAAPAPADAEAADADGGGDATGAAGVHAQPDERTRQVRLDETLASLSISLK